ncbi:MAG: endolytic transglycosylase MltG [Blastocatellia bacterium]|nr:endolytic transglycosylase MltG [Blastocatellia bacterium]
MNTKGLSDDASEKQIAPSPSRKRPVRRYAILFLLVLTIAGGAAAFLWAKATIGRAVEHPSADKIITIEPGTSTQSIIDSLRDAGIVRHPNVLKIYLRITGRGAHLKAGDYKFESPISPLQAIDKIIRGDVYFERVTIPEGFDRFDIAETLAARTGKASQKEFLRLMEDQTPILRLAPETRNLEGYLFPDTYIYTSKTTAEDLIQAMADRFKEVFTPEWTARAARLGLSVHQVITLASIIEEEARVPDERARISSVFMNRLRKGMLLASDPTFIYAAKLAGDYDGNPNQPRHRRRDSRYNTYVYPGLPPGPIASPGRASIEAALYPEDSDYLYFVVSGTTGRHKFSRTAAEHDLAVAEYRDQQRRQRQQQ